MWFVKCEMCFFNYSVRFEFNILHFFFYLTFLLVLHNDIVFSVLVQKGSTLGLSPQYPHMPRERKPKV